MVKELTQRVRIYLSKLTSRELYLLFALFLFVLLYLMRAVVSMANSIQEYLLSEKTRMFTALDTFITLKSRRTQLEATKKSLEDSYRSFIWAGLDVGELSKFEEIKTSVSKDGLTIDQFRVEPISSEKFAPGLNKLIYRVTFQANKLSAVVQYLNQLFTGEYKALPLKVKIDKKASNDGLIAVMEFLILKPEG